MTKKQLLEKLEKYPDDMEVIIANVMITTSDEGMPTFKIESIASINEIEGLTPEELAEISEEEGVVEDFIMLIYSDSTYINPDNICKELTEG